MSRRLPAADRPANRVDLTGQREHVTRLDDALFVQPGVESVLWLSDRTVLAVGAPRLCLRGVQGAVVRSLLNDRIRSILS